MQTFQSRKVIHNDAINSITPVPKCHRTRAAAMRSLKLVLAALMLLAHAGRAITVEAHRNFEPLCGRPIPNTAFLRSRCPAAGRMTPTNWPLYARRPHKLKLTAAGQFRIKPKTNKSVAKRFKITSTGKIMYKRACTNHLQRNKCHGARRRLKRSVQLKDPTMIRKILSVLHNR
ncbi:uncharacterized protein BXIN_0039 [Babesia sp. Xinjiang]|uniref:uncharacterized protein n=1 Tax=Babesia sp. Xinjiang TaxID=462227 RepID=UPI000A253499|nr:uncharacterized protein BXIN_0039 [Babesia sp. Xinjiang]ORM39769.1 hypothetical protein BXIN_0039 [Babesia sp. Xinjiang]